MGCCSCLAETEGVEMIMDEWVDVTRIDQIGLYKVEVNTKADKTRHKKNIQGVYGNWKDGLPNEKESDHINKPEPNQKQKSD